MSDCAHTYNWRDGAPTKALTYCIYCGADVKAPNSQPSHSISPARKPIAKVVRTETGKSHRDEPANPIEQLTLDLTDQLS